MSLCLTKTVFKSSQPVLKKFIKLVLTLRMVNFTLSDSQIFNKVFDSGCQLSTFQAENRFKRGIFKAKNNGLFIPKQLHSNFEKSRKRIFLPNKCSQ